MVPDKGVLDVLQDELHRWGAIRQPSRERLDNLELALRRFVERGERPERHGELRERLQKLRERLESLLADPTADPEGRRRTQAVLRLIDRALRAMEFAERLRQLRVERGLSVDRLADLAGIHASILYRLERGGFAPPSRRTLQRLAQALQVRLDDLAPTQRMGEQPVELEEAVGLIPRLDPLRRDERLLLQELVDWWLVRREQYLVLGPLGRGQEQVAELVRELVRVLASDPEDVRELRRSLLGRIGRAKDEELRRIARCIAGTSDDTQERERPK